MTFITKQTFNRLNEDLKQLSTRRQETVIDLDEARNQGDLSENAGYHAAKAKLREIDEKITYLKDIVSNATIINVHQVDSVMIGSYVKVYESYSDKQVVFRIVGEEDLHDSQDNVTHITYTSLVAKGLMNKIVGDDIELNLPAGVRNYTILHISADII